LEHQSYLECSVRNILNKIDVPMHQLCAIEINIVSQSHLLSTYSQIMT